MFESLGFGRLLFGFPSGPVCRAGIFLFKMAAASASEIEDLQSLIDRAQAFMREGKYAEAQAFHERRVTMMEAVHGPNHPQVAFALHYLAEALFWAIFRWPDRPLSVP